MKTGPQGNRGPARETRHLTRRQLLAGAVAAGGGVAADAFAIEPFRLLISRHDVPIPGLPAGLDGLRIAQVSDVHLPATPAAAEQAAHVVRQERPDVVVLTGDVIEGAAALPALTAFASGVRGTSGTFAVLGNWEHKGGVSVAAAARAYDAAGVRFLCNDSAPVAGARDGIRIIGFDDPVMGQPDPALALRDPGAVEIWLIHAPAYVRNLPPDTRRPALILSGHTHGGQIRLPGLTLFTPPGSGPYVSGWYHDTLAPMYVSRGIGTASIRARLFCPPELPIFTLRRA